MSTGSLAPELFVIEVTGPAGTDIVDGPMSETAAEEYLREFSELNPSPWSARKLAVTWQMKGGEA